MENDNNKPAAALPVIHRFVATPAPLFKARMPKGAEIIEMNIGSKGLNVFAMVDADADKEWRYFLLTPTGQPIPHGRELIHLKSISAGGPMIHVFGVPAPIAKKIGFKKFQMPVKAED